MQKNPTHVSRPDSPAMYSTALLSFYQDFLHAEDVKCISLIHSFDEFFGRSLEFTHKRLFYSSNLVLHCVSKKTSPTFLAITRESIDGFL